MKSSLQWVKGKDRPIPREEVEDIRRSLENPQQTYGGPWLEWLKARLALEPPDFLAEDILARPLEAILQIKVFADTDTVTIGDGKIIIVVSDDMDGMNLVDADAAVTTVSSSGTPTVQIRNITQAADMLTTRITIDVSEFTSYTAATPPVVDTANDDVATGNLIAVDVDVAGTGAKGLIVTLSFSQPS